MATELTYLPHLKTDAEHKAEERQAEHQQKLRDAAPELLEALENIINNCRIFCEDSMDVDDHAIYEARAAIAKAKP